MHHMARVTAMKDSGDSGNFLRRGESPLQHVSFRTVFIQTENTPNPESIKFVPTNTVSISGGGGFRGTCFSVAYTCSYLFVF